VWYQSIKIIHIMSSAILFGGGLAIVGYCFYMNRLDKIESAVCATKQSIMLGLVLVIGSGVMQFVTGLLLIYLNALTVIPSWLIYSAVAYFITIVGWIFSVYALVRYYQVAADAKARSIELSRAHHRYYQIWKWLIPFIFFALLCVLYLMINR
jgi:uncharacterized membrane protein